MAKTTPIPAPKNRKPISLDAVKKAFGGDVGRMKAFAEGCRKAHSTGQPGDVPADREAKD